MNKSEHDLAASYFKGSDLEAREQPILREVEAEIGFSPTRLLGKSRWWGSGAIGAFQYLGEYEGHPAVLKVQGVEPDISEADMLQAFSENNQSRLVRPPELYRSLPWSDEKRYGALVVEYLDGPKLISLPPKEEEVKQFFEVYRDYKQNCLGQPWLPEPTKPLAERTADDFQNWRRVADEQYPNNPHRHPEDEGLIQEGIRLLLGGYKNENWTFQHTHISTDGVFRQGEQFVLTSNMLWGWRAPFFDAVMGYHWYPYILGNHYERVTPGLIEHQKELWRSHIWQLPKDDNEKKQINLALLERQLAGLMLDALTVDASKPIAEHLVQSTRKEVEELIAIIGQ
jgi:hypothetical protein